MFNWDGCPAKLYDYYIEVGEVKESDVSSDECAVVELWIASRSESFLRDECRLPVRRPVYGVLKQIRKLCGERPVCVVVMCDDLSCDTMWWSGSVFLLLQQLKEENLLKMSIFYTKSDSEQINQMTTERKWRRTRDKEEFLTLLEMLDVVVYRRANFYCEADGDYFSKNSVTPEFLNKYVK